MVPLFILIACGFYHVKSRIMLPKLTRVQCQIYIVSREKFLDEGVVSKEFETKVWAAYAF